MWTDGWMDGQQRTVSDHNSSLSTSCELKILSKVSEKFFKEKVDKRTHAHTWLSLYKLWMGPNTRIIEKWLNIRIAKPYWIMGGGGGCEFHIIENILPKTVETRGPSWP